MEERREKEEKRRRQSETKCDLDYSLKLKMKKKVCTLSHCINPSVNMYNDEGCFLTDKGDSGGAGSRHETVRTDASRNFQ